MDNNNQPLALFCDCDGFEVALTDEGLNVKTSTSAEFFFLSNIRRLQVIKHADNTPGGAAAHQKQKRDRLALPYIVLIVGLFSLAAGYIGQSPELGYSGFVLLVTGAVFLRRARAHLKKEASLCYLRVELNNAQRDYPFEGNLIKRMDMSVLEAHFNQLKMAPAEMAEAV